MPDNETIPTPSQPLGEVDPNFVPTENTTEEKVYELTILLDSLMEEKKTQNKTYNAEIKRVKAEIKALIKTEEAPVPVAEQPLTPTPTE